MQHWMGPLDRHRGINAMSDQRQGHDTIGRRILNAVEPFIYARRWVTMGVLLALTAFFIWQASLLQRNAGFDKSIPLGHPYMQVLKQYQADFGSANTVLVALRMTAADKNPDIYNAQFLKRLKDVTDAVFFLPGIDRSHVSSLFTPDVRYIEVMADGFRGGNVVPSDYVPSEKEFAEIKRHVADAGIVGRYVSNDQRGAMVFAQLLEVNPVTGEKVDYDAIAKGLEGIRTKFEDQDIKVHILGFAKVVGDVIDETQVVVGFFVLTLVMTMILLWLYIGNFELALLPLVCSVTAVVWEFGLLHIFGLGLDPFAVLVPFLILAVSVSHGVQYVNAWAGEIEENHRNAFDASLHTWRRLAIYGTMAIMTDVAGFGMIALVPIDIIREMAVNACLGMAALLVTNKIMMPIWLTWVRVGNVKTFTAKQQARDHLFDPVWRLVSNMVRPTPAVVALLICGALLGWSLWAGQGLQVGDSQKGVPILLPDSRYNQDDRAVNASFAIGTDILSVIAETDASACTHYSVLKQIGNFAWRIENLTGAVASTISLPQINGVVYQAFQEGSPKWHDIPRNKYAIAQTLTQIPPSTGLLNPSCDAMPVLVFTDDHRAATIERIVAATKRFNAENAAEFFATHKAVDAKYCTAKTKARRETGVLDTQLGNLRVKLTKRGLTQAQIEADSGYRSLSASFEAQKRKWLDMNKVCPVNFALASGNVGVMAATNEVVHKLEKRILLYVYIAIVFCVFVSFFEWQSLVCLMLPLALVSWMAYAVMALLGIGMTVGTLPVMAMAVGIGVDYGIYNYATLSDALAGGFKMREAYYKTLRMTGKAVVFTGMTLSVGVATWLFSGLQYQRDMGKLLVFMFLANMFGAILIMPALARFILKPRELAPGEEPVFKPRH